MTREEKIRTAVAKAIELIMDGKFQEENPLHVCGALAMQQVPDVTIDEVNEAVESLKHEHADAAQQSLTAVAVIEQVQPIIDKYHDPSRPEETVGEIVTRAAEAGDPLALAMLRRVS